MFKSTYLLKNMKKILGLDLGTNSIGWAVINKENDNLVGIDSAGSRIIPMDAATLSDFAKGNTKSQTADRTLYRSVRRLRERYLLRRERLHKVLHILNFLPAHYDSQIGWDKSDNKTYGKFINNAEPKINWRKVNDKYEFIFMNSFREMLEDFKINSSIKGEVKIPQNWTLYYLRKKALTQKISKGELSWILLNFNHKRGYSQLRDEEENEESEKNKSYEQLKVIKVEDSGELVKGKKLYDIYFDNGLKYDKKTTKPENWLNKVKEFIVTTSTLKDGSTKYSFKAVDSTKDWIAIKKKTEQDVIKSKETVGSYIYDTLLKNQNQKINGKLISTIERKFYKDELNQIITKQIEFHEELRDRDLYKKCIENLYTNNDDYRNSISGRDFKYLLLDNILFYQRPLKTKKSLISNCPYEKRNYRNKETNELVDVPIKCTVKSNPYFQEFRLWQFISNIRIYQKEKYVEITNKKATYNKLETDVDVTSEFIRNEDDRVKLFEWLNDRKEIDQKAFLKNELFKKIKKDIDSYRWNYVEDKKYPCNKTRAAILAKLNKSEKEKLTPVLEYKIWHLLYSIHTKEEIDKALSENKSKNNKIYNLLKESFSQETIVKLKTIKFEEKDYASYSEKAIKKLLSLMRIGKYWKEENINKYVLDRINKILTGEYDENIKEQVRKKSSHFSKISEFKGLSVSLACYVIYNRHSENSDIIKWNTPKDIDDFLNDFKLNSLRNPIVEQVITETLRVVRDIWKKIGHIDEIHVELARDIKNPSNKRKQISERNSNNENTNLRIKAILQEFENPEYDIENVRAYSKSQQDLFKIYEDTVLTSVEVPDDINNIIKKFNESDKKKQPSFSDVKRYRLWLEQKYCSPYTGEVIPLSKLFTSAYEIEHVIPQSRFFDDSFSNKVICESAVNKLKGNLLGHEFILNNHGEKVEVGNGKTVTILSLDSYEEFVSKNYYGNKKKKLLYDDIPEEFSQRQLNDSRYISKYIKGLLSNIVREKLDNGEYEPEAISKNLIVNVGGITDILKKDWGMNDVWNSIILPRFQRLNEITNTQKFTTTTANGHVIPTMPIELQKGFNKKRIDHRHHAMDAIVIACVTRAHVQYISTINSQSGDYKLKRGLANKLRNFKTVKYPKWITNANGVKVPGPEKISRSVPTSYIKPWATFTQDSKKVLENIIVSFKQNLRVVNETSNYYYSYRDSEGKLYLDKNGNKIKKLTKQSDGHNTAIRKPLHKETNYGLVNLKRKTTTNLKEVINNPEVIVNKALKEKIKELLNQNKDYKQIKKYFDNEDSDVWSDINFKKIEIYFYSNDTNNKYVATRFTNDLVNVFSGINKYDKAIKKIESITDESIQKILINHLHNNNDDPLISFSADGIEKMNANIKELNNGKSHHPIYKVRLFETLGEKFALGKIGNKSSKYVEAAKGTNLYYGIYSKKINNKKTGEITYKRVFETIPLNKVIERLKNKLSPVPETNSDGDKLMFYLSPGDLVYVPTKSDIENIDINHSESLKKFQLQDRDKDRIYKAVSFTGKRSYFIKESVAVSIVNKVEFSALNKLEQSLTGEMIKNICIPIKLDRLGNILK